MDATPADLKKWPTNIYSQIAIALKGGELRDVGLNLVAAKLAGAVVKLPGPRRLPTASALQLDCSNSRLPEAARPNAGVAQQTELVVESSV
eukprot:2318118-Prymnesium_polylepis.1